MRPCPCCWRRASTCRACTQAIRQARRARGLPRPARARAHRAAQLQERRSKAKQTPERLIARKDLVTALEAGPHAAGPAPEAQPRAARCAGGRCQRRQPRRRAVPAAGRLGCAHRDRRAGAAGRARSARRLDRHTLRSSGAPGRRGWGFFHRRTGAAGVPGAISAGQHRQLLSGRSRQAAVPCPTGISADADVRRLPGWLE
jgi:hypothetical protein